MGKESSCQHDSTSAHQHINTSATSVADRFVAEKAAPESTTAAKVAANKFASKRAAAERATAAKKSFWKKGEEAGLPLLLPSKVYLVEQEQSQNVFDTLEQGAVAATEPRVLTWSRLHCYKVWSPTSPTSPWTRTRWRGVTIPAARRSANKLAETEVAESQEKYKVKLLSTSFALHEDSSPRSSALYKSHESHKIRSPTNHHKVGQHEVCFHKDFSQRGSLKSSKKSKRIALDEDRSCSPRGPRGLRESLSPRIALPELALQKINLYLPPRFAPQEVDQHEVGQNEACSHASHSHKVLSKRPALQRFAGSLRGSALHEARLLQGSLLGSLAPRLSTRLVPRLSRRLARSGHKSGLLIDPGMATAIEI